MIFAFASRPFDKVQSVSETKDLHCCGHFFPCSERCNRSLPKVTQCTKEGLLPDDFGTVIWSNFLPSLMNNGYQTTVPDLLILFSLEAKGSHKVQKWWEHSLQVENLTECRLLHGKLAPRAFLADDAELECIRSSNDFFKLSLLQKGLFDSAWTTLYPLSLRSN